MDRGETDADQAAGHDAEAPEAVTGAHDQLSGVLLDRIRLDVEAELERRQGRTDDGERHEEDLDIRGPCRQPDERQKHNEAVEDGGATADPGDQASGKRQRQENADGHSEQCDCQFRRSEAKPLLHIGDARQPSAEGDRLKEEDQHDETLIGHAHWSPTGIASRDQPRQRRPG
ncbi:hypothetical protein D9M72_454980 [compost metagenome]